MKKEYIKPEIQMHDIKMTQILCGSNDGDPDEYSGSFGYVPGQHKEDEIQRV